MFQHGCCRSTKLQADKMEATRGLEAAKVRNDLMDECQRFLTRFPRWDRAKVVKSFPEFEPIIDIMMGEDGSENE